MAWIKTTTTVEAKFQLESQKAYLVELTLGGRYWLPKKCLTELERTDGDGNWNITVSDWWWDKKDPDFDADIERVEEENPPKNGP